MRKFIGILLSGLLALTLVASAAAAPQQAVVGQSAAAAQQNLPDQAAAMRARVCDRLAQRIQARISEGYPELFKGKLTADEMNSILEQLQQYAQEQLQTELAAEQSDAAVKDQVKTELQAQLRETIREQIRSQIKDRMMEQIKARIAEKKQFRTQLAKGEFQFKNKGEIRANGRAVKFDVPPVIKDGRTLVPVRALTEALGAEVTWDQATNSVTVTLGDTVIMLVIGDNVIYVNGEQITLDTQSANVNGRTVLPLRAIVEHLDGKITYDPTTNDIDVTLPEDGTATQ